MPDLKLLSVASLFGLLATNPALAQDATPSPAPAATQATTPQGPPTAPAADAAAPAAAEAPASSIYINGSIVIASQYRYRGLSYTNNDPTAQVFLTVSHKSGLYVGFFGSNLSGDGTFGGDNLEADVYAGWLKTVGKVTFDTGVWRYQFPGTKNFDFLEVYSSASIPVGPAKIKPGFYYAPKQKNIGNNDNLSLYTDASLPITKTPITLKGHIGYQTGAGSTLAGPTGVPGAKGHYFDYLVGADVTWRNFTLNVSYVDTDIDLNVADSYYAIAGRKVVSGHALVTLTAAF